MGRENKAYKSYEVFRVPVFDSRATRYSLIRMTWLANIARWSWRLVKSLGPLRLLFGLLLLALVTLDLYCEVYGLPEEGMNGVRAVAFAHGFRVEMRELRVGLLYGIRAEGVELWDGQKAHVKIAEARSVRVAFRVPALFRGRFRPTDVSVTGLEVYLPSRRVEERAFPALALLRLDFLLHIRSHEIIVSSLSGSAGGIRLNASGRLSELGEGEMNLGTLGLGGFGWDALLGDRREAALRALEAVTDVIAPRGIPRSEGSLDVRFDVPLQQPRLAAAWGAFALSDLVLRDVELRKLRGKLAFRERQLQLEDLSVQVLGDQTATAHLRYDLDTGIAQGEAQGLLDPQVLFRLTGRVAPRLLTEVKLGRPLELSMTLAPSPLDLARLKATLVCRGQGIWYQDLGLGELDGTLNLDNGTMALQKLTVKDFTYRGLKVARLEAAATGDRERIDVRDLKIVVDPAGKEKLSGTLTLFPAAGEGAADIAGNIYPVTLTKLAPGLSAAVASVTEEFEFNGPPPEFTCRLERSPLKWDVCAGVLTVTMRDARFRDLGLQQVTAKAVLKDAAFDVAIKVVCKDPNPGSFEADLKLLPATGTLHGRLAAEVHPDRIYKALRLPDNYIVSRLAFSGAPVKAAVVLAESSFDPALWRATGTIALEHGHYETLELKTGTCNLEITPGALAFKSIHAMTSKDEALDCDLLSVTIPDGNLLIQGTVRADPLFAEVFVPPGSARDFYRCIWDNLKWSPTAPPFITVKRLECMNTTGSQRSSFTIDGALEAKDFTYKGYKIDALGVKVNLELPRRLDLANIQVSMGKASAAGDMHMEFEDVASCKFSFTAASDPRLILKIINPEWDGFFCDVRFAEDSAVTCDGSFFFGQEARTRLRGTLKSGPGAYRKIQFSDLDVKWLLDGTRMAWPQATAKVYGGLVSSSGMFDFDAEAGQTTLALTRIGLEHLAGALGMPKGKQLEGRLSGNCRLELIRAKPDAPMQLTGGGRTWLSEGDLWNLPFFNSLGELVGMTSLGKISRLDATLDFAGDHVQFTEFHTDGTLLALHGQGDYFWGNNQADLAVRGEALKNTQIVPMLLKPLFWFFEAELKGDLKDARWRLARGSRKDEAE